MACLVTWKKLSVSRFFSFLEGNSVEKKINKMKPFFPYKETFPFLLLLLLFCVCFCREVSQCSSASTKNISKIANTKLKHEKFIGSNHEQDKLAVGLANEKHSKLVPT